MDEKTEFQIVSATKQLFSATWILSLAAQKNLISETRIAGLIRTLPKHDASKGHSKGVGSHSKEKGHFGDQSVEKNMASYEGALRSGPGFKT